jgi:hypothetical protein
MAGFEVITLTKEEEMLLRAFDYNNELVVPNYAMAGYLEPGIVNKALNMLVSKQVVKRDRPFKLTKRGIKLKRSLDAVSSSY